MLPMTSDAIRYSGHSVDQARPSHPGRLSRLLFKVLPLWNGSNRLEKPRRSIDRELQEREPIDLWS
jgi:hypothetical protein